MSKIHFLLGLLLIIVAGVVTLNQIQQATESSYRLIANEIQKKIEIQIRLAYSRLQRYPDSGNEFEMSVLNQLHLHRFRCKVEIGKYRRGNAVSPATFSLYIGSTGKKEILNLNYYGCEYRENVSFQGRLL